MSVEPNNTLVNAERSGVSSEGRRSTILDGSIDPESDVDLYQFQVNAGDGIILDLDAAEFDSGLDGMLRLFDAAGNELAQNDDRPSPGEVFSLDSYLTFIANATGDYYVGVSSTLNSSYNPIDGDSDDENSTGNYQLEISLVEVVVEEDPNDTIAEAVATALNLPGESATFIDEIDVGQDLDIFQIRLKAGSGLILDIDTTELNSTLDSQLRLFDGEGNELASSDDNPALDEEFSTDSYLTYIAQSSDDYYIGVSTAENSVYDPIYGRTNLDQNESTNSGSYQLNIELVEIESDRDPDNTLSEAVDSQIIASGQYSAAIADSISPQGDVDVFELSLDAGNTATFNLNAAELDTGLDSALRLFDADGNQLLTLDDAAAPGEDLATIDAYLEFTAATTGQYYVAISGYPNTDYDVVNGRDNLGFDQEAFSIGDYELIINAFDRVEGTNDEDILWGNSTNTFIQGLQGDDRLTAGGNNDYLIGDSGNDTLSGNNGNDTLIGGTGFDLLSGGAGADVLQGDRGNDKLRGGTEADIFVLAEDNDTTLDTILDFEDGIDKILLQNGSSFDDIIVEDLTSKVGVAVFTLDGKAIAHLFGIKASDFSVEDLAISVNPSAIE